MKLVIILLTTAIIQVSAASYAQKVTMKQHGIELVNVFQEIRKQTGYDFLYSDKIMEQAKPVDLNLQDVGIEEALEICFKDQPLSYSIENKIVTVRLKKPGFLSRIAAAFGSIDASGRVVDSENRPLPGASVKVKKTEKGVSTDKDGRFFLRGVEEGAVLVVSFIGYLPKEVSASANMGNVVLEQSLSKLDEVQVIAYGTTTQRLSTGNVTTIKADVIEKQPVNNPLLALQGRVPGLFIEQATGFAGTGVKVRIQGQNSYRAGNDPLYVIDGVPFNSQLLPGANPILGNSGVTARYSNTSGASNPLNFINPADIESIDILKDADATSIYGSRAANGAILITTKKGKAGDTRVNLNLQSGWAKVPRKLEIMNSQQYLEMRMEAFRNDGITEPGPGPYGDSDLNGTWDKSRNADWQEELIGGTAQYQDANASISGGTDKTAFLIGTGYHRETNVFPGDFADQKGSIRFSINNSSANNRFKLQFSGSYLFDNNKLPNVDMTNSAIKLAPVAPEIYLPDGSINWGTDEYGYSSFENPIAVLNDKFFNKTQNLMSNMILSYEILPGFELKSNFGYNSLGSSSNSKAYIESNYPEIRPYLVRSTTFGSNTSASWIVEPQLTYYRNVNRGRLELLFGGTIRQDKSIGSSIIGYGFSNDLVMDDLLSAPFSDPVSSIGYQSKYIAAFGRVNYNWLNKYIINLSLRRDGSSKFGPKSQFHNFASVGSAWIFSDEEFIKEQVKFLSFGKLRASYGTTGSDQIGDYRFMSLYQPQSTSLPYQGTPSYRPIGIPNPYLQWEETRKLSIGLDLGFFRDRILLNANYYRNTSSNQLSEYTLPITTGSIGITRNQAFKIRNSGWEVMLTTNNLKTNTFTWSSSINLTRPKTLLVDYPEIIKSSAASTAIIGQPLSVIKLYHFLGVDPATGKYQFEDKNGNPTFTPNAEEDKFIEIDAAPKFFGGIQNTISFKGFQLDVLFSFVNQKGQDFSYGYRTSSPGAFGGGSYNQPISVLNRWRQPGDISTIQKYTTGYDQLQSQSDVYNSDATWVDASYIRLKNASLSWILPEKIAHKIKINSCDIFIQGQNLWTITGFNGLDPETKSSLTLPPLRVIVIGMKISL